MRAEALAIWIAVCLILRAADAQPPGVPAPEPSPSQNMTEPMVVCAAPEDPFVVCNETSPTDTYTGFDVELFRRVANEVNLVENATYVFKCMPFTEMLTQLENLNGTCDVGIGAITITTERQDQGIQFTYPTYSSSLSVIVKANGRKSGGWAWVQPFSLDLWIAVGLTLLIFPVFLFLIEFGSLKRRIYAQDVIQGLDVAATRAVHTLISTEPLEVSSSGAKVASILFLFLSMIVLSTYIANLAAVLTVHTINSQITSIDQLRGKAVVSNAVYLDKLRSRYGILAIELNSDDPNALRDASKLVINGELAAVISDAALIENLLLSIPGCAVRQLPNADLEPFSYGFGVKNGTIYFEHSLSEAILKLQEEGDIQNLAEGFLGFNARDDCGNLEEEDYSVNFHSIYGLWVLLGFGIVVGFILMFFSRRRRKLSKRKKSRGTGASSSSGNGKGGGQGPLPRRRDLVTLGGISEQAEAQDLEEQHQQDPQQQQNGADGAAAVGAVTAPQASVKKKKSASVRWKEVVDSMSALQNRSSIFSSSTWQSRDDIERQQTMDDGSSEEE